MTRHALSMMLSNVPGALARVVVLFSTRGVDVESLSLDPTERGDVSRRIHQARDPVAHDAVVSSAAARVAHDRRHAEALGLQRDEPEGLERRRQDEDIRQGEGERDRALVHEARHPDPLTAASEDRLSQLAVADEDRDEVASAEGLDRQHEDLEQAGVKAADVHLQPARECTFYSADFAKTISPRPGKQQAQLVNQSHLIQCLLDVFAAAPHSTLRGEARITELDAGEEWVSATSQKGEEVRARLLLLQTSLSVLDVALACGFVSASHFSKCYREQFGRTPRAERGMPPAAPEPSRPPAASG